MLPTRRWVAAFRKADLKSGWHHLRKPMIAMIVAAVAPIIIGARGERLTGPLPERFQRLGAMDGKTAGEIIAKVGPPNARSATPDGTLLQWQSTRYHIAIAFDEEDRFVQIEHEAAV